MSLFIIVNKYLNNNFDNVTNHLKNKIFRNKLFNLGPRFYNNIEICDNEQATLTIPNILKDF